MKRRVLFIFVFLITAKLFAQDIEKQDNDIKINIDELIIPDGYLLDMKDILPAPPALAIPVYDWRDMKNDNRFDEAFFYRDNIRYGRTEGYSLHNGFSRFYGSDNISLNQATFTLKNGMKISTFGEYDADGYKRRNPSALPWQRNNFNGAFQMKSRNGSFGISVEVNRGRYSPY